MKVFSVLLWGTGAISAIFLFTGISTYAAFLLWCIFCKVDNQAEATLSEPEVTCELVTVDLSDEQHENLSTDDETDAESVETMFQSDESY